MLHAWYGIAPLYSENVGYVCDLPLSNLGSNTIYPQECVLGTYRLNNEVDRTNPCMEHWGIHRIMMGHVNCI